MKCMANVRWKRLSYQRCKIQKYVKVAETLSVLQKKNIIKLSRLHILGIIARFINENYWFDRAQCGVKHWWFRNEKKSSIFFMMVLKKQITIQKWLKSEQNCLNWTISKNKRIRCLAYFWMDKNYACKI